MSQIPALIWWKGVRAFACGDGPAQPPLRTHAHLHSNSTETVTGTINMPRACCSPFLGRHAQELRSQRETESDVSGFGGHHGWSSVVGGLGGAAAAESTAVGEYRARAAGVRVVAEKAVSLLRLVPCQSAGIAESSISTLWVRAGWSPELSLLSPQWAQGSDLPAKTCGCKASTI